MFIVSRSLQVCDSRGLQFVAKICHKCSLPGAQATRQNLKKIARVAAALCLLCMADECCGAFALETFTISY